MTETLTGCDRPVAFGYDITDLRGALSPLVERIEGLYAFEKAGTGTRVTWSWVLAPQGRIGAAATADLRPDVARVRTTGARAAASARWSDSNRFGAAPGPVLAFRFAWGCGAVGSASRSQ